MSLSLVQSCALLGLEAAIVTVEVHLANGLPSFTLVGLADVEVKEARERVRSAILNSGLEFPHNKRITVNLAPADLPKDSGRFDLPIALGVLAASEQIGAEPAGRTHVCRRVVAVGQSAAGARRPGDEPGAAGRKPSSLQQVLPPESAEEAALVPGAEVYRAEHLLDVVRRFLPAGSDVPHARSGARLEPGARRPRLRWRPAMPTWPTSRARAAPNGRWRSPPPAGTAS